MASAALFIAVSELLNSDSENELEIIVNHLLFKRKRKRMCIENYVNNVALLYNPDDFKSHFRLRRDTFQELVEILDPHLKSKSTTSVGRPMETPEKQLLIALSMLSNQEVFRTIAERFDVSKSTAWTYVHKICDILVELSGNYIKWPTAAEVTKVTEQFKERQRFYNVIGVMDGTHIPITPPAKQQRAYFNRNKYHSILLQAVCTAEYMFTDVFAGFPGSAHDARVFRNSDLGKKIEENPEALFPQNSHILADSAYKNTNYVLTPFRDNGHLTRVQRRYNYKHSATRVYIEQAFGLLKGRFRILKHVNIYRTELIAPLILACCVLHNICMKKKDIVEPYFDVNEDQPNIHYNGNDNTGLNKRNDIAHNLSVEQQETF